MISFTISVYNEYIELQNLLETVKSAQTPQDEIVILHTYKNEDEKTSGLFQEIEQLSKQYSNIYKNFHFQNRFAEMKNSLNSLATKKYIVNFDADEFASLDTINLWKNIINNNNNDLYYVPRINTVSNYTLEDIKKYSWNINQKGWINWPDYQPRIYQNNGKIKWVGDVHEYLEGFVNRTALPQDPRLAIIHSKDIERQRKQNEFYENIL